MGKLRRHTRERREYIHSKSIASQEQQTFQRKQMIKDLLAKGKPLPTELRRDAKEMGGKDLVLDEAQRDPGHIDDEYAKVGTYDPRILITTSRSPSSRLLQFSKVSISKTRQDWAMTDFAGIAIGIPRFRPYESRKHRLERSTPLLHRSKHDRPHCHPRDPRCSRRSHRHASPPRSYTLHDAIQRGPPTRCQLECKQYSIGAVPSFDL
jgi:hypothetical protein